MAKKKTRAPSRVDFPEVTRSIDPNTKQCLIAASGGRCEFIGCNQYLFAHKVTKTTGYFGNYAHIRAFSSGGPRAGSPEVRASLELNEIENLMLLCRDCHALVDTREDDFPIAKLQAWKRLHEERVAYLLDLPTENETSVIEIWTSLAMTPVVRSHGKVVAALLPLYPSRIRSCLIDLANHNLSDLTLIPAAIEQIDSEVTRLFSTLGERPTHVALFGITNMPLLIHLGAKLGDRQDVLLFQYHRDTKDWRWKDEPARAAFTVDCRRTGSDLKHVAVLVSVSGTIDIADLPAELDNTYSIYEIRLSNETPNTGCLRAKEDLDRFRDTYRRFLSQLQVDHGLLTEIAIVPAVPIPVAVSLGMDRLPKVAPALNVYDASKTASGAPTYRFVLRVA